MCKKIFILSIILTFIFSSIVFAGFPVSVRDDLGQLITLTEEPERIISLNPASTELLFALDLGEKIVGVTTYANYPPEAVNKEKIGTVTEPNIEKIVSLEPDLIFTSSVNKIESVERLSELGCNVVGFDAKSVNGAIEMIKTAGELTGKEDKARELVTDMYIQLYEIKELVDEKLKDSSRPKVFYEIWNEPLYTAGANTFINDIIEIAGGINIGVQARGQWPQFSLEKLLLENPDVYISSPHSAPHQVTVESIKERDNYQNIKAVQNERIYVIDQDVISRPSPRIVEGLKLVTKAIFPDLAGEIDNIK